MEQTTNSSAAEPVAVVSVKVQRTQRAPNYFKKHLMGDYTLGISFWFSSVFIAGFLVPMLLAIVMMHSGSALAVMTMIAALIITYAWSIVGLWRSASKHVERGGKPIWAVLTQIWIAIGVVLLMIQFALPVVM